MFSKENTGLLVFVTGDYDSKKVCCLYKKSVNFFRLYASRRPWCYSGRRTQILLLRDQHSAASVLCSIERTSNVIRDTALPGSGTNLCTAKSVHRVRHMLNVSWKQSTSRFYHYSILKFFIMDKIEFNLQYRRRRMCFHIIQHSEGNCEITSSFNQ